MARWLLLIHQLPRKPLYLRAKIRQRLASVGALALKNSVYVLPQRDECLEDMQWIAQEALAGGGEAFVVLARCLAGLDDAFLRRRFEAESDAAWRRLLAEIEASPRRADQGSGGPARLSRLWRRLAAVAAVDFFGAPARRQVEDAMQKLERGDGKQRKAPKRPGPATRGLSGRVWVTRRDPKVDRLACAWLIRRFVDPRARFRFVDKTETRLRPGEIGFDMPGGTYSHEGERCSFETLIHRIGLRDPGLRPIAEIVHDIDLKDDKFGRPETEGVRAVISGLVRGVPEDAARLDQGNALFDSLYHALSPGRSHA